jgi:DNA-binding transcriptional MocR family regulator
VLSEQLTYPGMKALASHAELRLHPVAIDDEGVSPDALDAACRATAARALYLMPTVHNPTTSIMPLERRQRIVEVARRHSLILIEDDVYGFLAEPSPPPLATLAPELTFYLTSFSKSLAPGLRIGYVVPPPARFDDTIGAVRATQWMAGPLPAAIASHLIESGQAHAIAEGHRAEARARQRIARDILGTQAILAYPNAFHIWLGLPEPWRRDEFVAELRRRGVLVTSADAFAVGRSPTPHAVRVCLGGAVRSHGELETALKKVALLLAGRDRPHLSIV